MIRSFRKSSRLKFIGFLALFFLCVSAEKAQAYLQACPQYRSQTAQCKGPFIKLGAAGIGLITQAYCGQGGSSCCDCATTQTNLQEQMDIHRRGGGGQPSFLFKTYWDGTVHPGLLALLSEIYQHIKSQTTGRGGFSSAQDSSRSASALQQGAAEASRNYSVSESLCRYGSLSQSLGADDIKRSTAQMLIATQALKREIGAKGNSAQSGAASDVKARMDEYVKEYCNPNQGDLSLMCGGASQRHYPNLPKDTRYNLDISYARTIGSNGTIDVDTIGNTGATEPKQQDVIALESNLYGNNQLAGRMTEKSLSDLKGQQTFLKVRSAAATRGVAENTYAAIAAMKSRGSGGSRPYMQALLEQLGGADLAESMLDSKPSYYAQMDVLTKKLYQEPSFYVNLMEGKTNVARQSDAMEGIEVMQDRDMYQSMRRSETLLAVMIQLETRKLLNDTAENVNTRHE